MLVFTDISVEEIGFNIYVYTDYGYLGSISAPPPSPGTGRVVNAEVTQESLDLLPDTEYCVWVTPIFGDRTTGAFEHGCGTTVVGVTATCAACNVVFSGPVTASGPGCGAPCFVPTTATETCTPSFVGATPTVTKSTDCTLVFTAPAGRPFNNGVPWVLYTITADNATFLTLDDGGRTLSGVTTNRYRCENAGVHSSGGVLSNSNQTSTCVVGPIIVTGPTTLCGTVTIIDRLNYSSFDIDVCPLKALAGESTTTTLAGSGAAAYLSSGAAPLPPTPTTTPAPTHASIASAPAIAPWPQLPSSSPQIEAVTSLQYLLQQCAAPTLSADGKFGPETDAAVRAFQKAQGLPDDGKVGAATWQALIVPPMPVQQNMPMCMPMPPGMSMPLMQQGSTGPAVKAVQSQLNTPSRLSARAGVALTVDGVFGPSGGPTDTAVKAYQTGQGLPANGQVGADTWQSLVAGS